MRVCTGTIHTSKKSPLNHLNAHELKWNRGREQSKESRLVSSSAFRSLDSWIAFDISHCVADFGRIGSTEASCTCC